MRLKFMIFMQHDYSLESLYWIGFVLRQMSDSSYSRHAWKLLPNYASQNAEYEVRFWNCKLALGNGRNDCLMLQKMLYSRPPQPVPSYCCQIHS